VPAREGSTIRRAPAAAERRDEIAHDTGSSILMRRAWPVARAENTIDDLADEVLGQRIEIGESGWAGSRGLLIDARSSMHSVEYEPRKERTQRKASCPSAIG